MPATAAVPTAPSAVLTTLRQQLTSIVITYGWSPLLPQPYRLLRQQF
ncbi:hypothetical protein [Timonella senegalensis]|nr:hypothetical protein [Timonella senegalensis]